MGLLRTFRLTNNMGAPITGATPTFLQYVGVGDVPVEPSIFELEAGVYAFNLDNASYLRVWQIDGDPTAIPRYFVGANIGDSDFGVPDVQAWGTYDPGTGVPADPTDGPEFTLYVDGSDLADTPPAIEHPGVGLFYFAAQPTNVTAGRAYVVDTDNDDTVLPLEVSGTVGLERPAGGGVTPEVPSITNVAPAAPGPLSTMQAWQADVEGVISEVIVWVSYATLNTVEVAYDGSAFTPDFNGQSSVEDLGGGSIRLVVKRNTGWPDSPRFHLRARTTTGGVNV